MKKRKKEFKWFTIFQYEKEQEYLNSMHRMGWKLIHITFPGWYYFVECEPEDMVYQLDYNPDGLANKEEYTQLFEDCGWKYLFDFVGYSYFRKRRDENDTGTEIFCDDVSRLDMMKRVLTGRMLPLLVVFLCMILPQLFLHMNRSLGGFWKGIYIFYLIHFFLYVGIFANFGYHYFKYEQKVLGESQKTKSKIYGMYLGLLGLVVFVGAGSYFRLTGKESVYSFSEHQDGYTISAEYFDKRVEQRYDLNKGDVVWVDVQRIDGEFRIVIECEGQEPIFTGTGSLASEFGVTVGEAGEYTISCEGIEAEGEVSFWIERK